MVENDMGLKICTPSFQPMVSGTFSHFKGLFRGPLSDTHTHISICHGLSEKKATFCHPLNAGSFGAASYISLGFWVPAQQELSIDMHIHLDISRVMW